MTNPPISIFSYSDPSLIIFNDIGAEDSSEVLKNRFVNTIWKGHSDELIRMFWRDLHQIDPKGAVNVSQTMELIDLQVNSNNPAILKFAKLMSTFKQHGSPIPGPSPVLVTIGDYRALQEEYDNALKTVWPQLRDKLDEFLNVGLPEPDAHVNEIRQFLNDNKRSFETIKFLDLSQLGLTLIPPELKLFTQLTELILAGNNLTNISPLEGLTKLVELNLSDNRLTDISPLEGLKNIRILHLDHNQLQDVSSLKGMTELSELDLSNNQLTDISPLNCLAQLRVLGLTGNQLNDISPLKGLVNLRTITLSSNFLTDVSPLIDLKNLNTLYLSKNQLTDISPLAGLVGLKRLALGNNQLAKVSPLAGVVNLAVISGFANLMRLELNNNQLTDISPLESFTNLKELDLSNNQLTEVVPLANLTKLRQLNLLNNPVKNTSPLKTLKQTGILLSLPSIGFSSAGKRSYDTAFGTQQ